MNIKTIGILLTVVMVQACGMNKNTTPENTSVSKVDIRIHDIFVAIKINGENVERRDEMPRMELNLNTMQIFGNNGCNEFQGKITAVTEKDISLSGMSATKKMCADMVLPRIFGQALLKTISYKFEDLHLIFYGNEGQELITFLKVD